MTAAAGFVQLPSDSGNTGKKMRTISRTVGADSVHEHFFIPSSSRDYLGAYLYHSGNFTIQAAAQNGTSTGFLWLINPIGNTNKVSLSRLRYIHQLTTNLALTTAPRVVTQLFTFTGTASGAATTPGKMNSAYPAATGSLRTAMTGLTITLGAIIDASLPLVTAGTAGWTFTAPSIDDNIANSEMSDIVLSAGEGTVTYQADAGTAADTRRLICDIATTEWN